MKIYCVIDQHGKNQGIYHDTDIGAIHYFMMSGKKGAYIGKMMDDWNNFKESGTKVQEYDIIQNRRDDKK